MNISSAAMSLLILTSCAHVEQAPPSASAIKTSYHTIKQTRLDLYKVSYVQSNASSEGLTPTLILYGAGGNIEDMSKLFEPSPGELFIFALARAWGVGREPPRAGRQYKHRSDRMTLLFHR